MSCIGLSTRRQNYIEVRKGQCEEGVGFNDVSTVSRYRLPNNPAAQMQNSSSDDTLIDLREQILSRLKQANERHQVNQQKLKTWSLGAKNGNKNKPSPTLQSQNSSVNLTPYCQDLQFPMQHRDVEDKNGLFQDWYGQSTKEIEYQKWSQNYDQILKCNNNLLGLSQSYDYCKPKFIGEKEFAQDTNKMNPFKQHSRSFTQLLNQHTNQVPLQNTWSESSTQNHSKNQRGFREELKPSVRYNSDLTYSNLKNWANFDIQLELQLQQQQMQAFRAQRKLDFGEKKVEMNMTERRQFIINHYNQQSRKRLKNSKRANPKNAFSYDHPWRPAGTLVRMDSFRSN
eukprot:TRINITY_DN20834_c1_g1_i3.p2 TRINITY_DN20834_c1_g1~~TRINITY_DN20834_c1_g1_i3.p2  ORF type:complete len:341 (-),score=13.52 TRINITY_DN20834_c1_g1_i3:33-1055(-)